MAAAPFARFGAERPSSVATSKGQHRARFTGSPPHLAASTSVSGRVADWDAAGNDGKRPSGLAKGNAPLVDALGTARPSPSVGYNTCPCACTVS